MVSFIAVAISFVVWMFIPVIGAAAFGYCLFAWVAGLLFPNAAVVAGVIGGIAFFLLDAERHS